MKSVTRFEEKNEKIQFLVFCSKLAPEFKNRYLASQFFFVFRKNDVKVDKIRNLKMFLEKNKKHIHDRQNASIPNI